MKEFLPKNSVFFGRNHTLQAGIQILDNMLDLVSVSTVCDSFSVVLRVFFFVFQNTAAYGGCCQCLTHSAIDPDRVLGGIQRFAVITEAKIQDRLLWA